MKKQGHSARGPPWSAPFARATVCTTVNLHENLEPQARENNHANPLDQQ
jgi:hypothetical protein